MSRSSCLAHQKPEKGIALLDTGWLVQKTQPKGKQTRRWSGWWRRSLERRHISLTCRRFKNVWIILALLYQLISQHFTAAGQLFYLLCQLGSMRVWPPGLPLLHSAAHKCQTNQIKTHMHSFLCALPSSMSRKVSTTVRHAIGQTEKHCACMKKLTSSVSLVQCQE